MFILLVFSIVLLKETEQQSVAYSGSIIRKREGRSFWANISYIILKRRDDTNREGNNVTNAYITRGP
jgi:hypothetical protein